ncbi:nitroreductase [Sphaerisporangium sp. NBC_01403]|uniref:nitroreductase n=1 Tax=Sphaerisporangium sp. NBC_01403 TaxID=2903599 RepID=UPI00324887F8
MGAVPNVTVNGAGQDASVITDEPTRLDVALERILVGRHSCRAFLSEQVPAELIERMFALAQHTASWCNSQAWQVILTSGEATERFRAELYAAASTRPARSDIPEPEEYHGVYQARRREAGYGLYGSLGIDRKDFEARSRQMLENFRFFGAPHVAVITSDRSLGPYGYIDCGAYVSTLLQAAESLGIAAIPQAAIAMRSDTVRAHFQIPDDRVIVCGVSFGYADTEHPANSFRTGREAPANVVDRHDR